MKPLLGPEFLVSPTNGRNIVANTDVVKPDINVLAGFSSHVDSDQLNEARFAAADFPSSIPIQITYCA